MFQDILDDWAESRMALEVAAKLNREDVSKHLLAQAEGYAVACCLYGTHSKDPAKLLLKLAEAGETLRLTAKILTNQEAELSTIADILHNCHSNIHREIPDTCS